MKTSNSWKTQLLLGTALLILTVSPSTPALGQTLHSAPSHQTLDAAFDARPVAQVEIGTFRFAPGFPGRVHTHKAPVFGYVSKGVVNYYLEDRKLTLHAGDVFYEPVGPRIFLDILGIGIIIPVLPSLVAELARASATSQPIGFGLLLGVYALMQFLFAPILGGLSDRIGRRPVLLASTGGLAADFLLSYVAPNMGGCL